MGIYSEYLSKGMDFAALTAERKKLLAKISKLRRGRDVLVYASDLTKMQLGISIEYSDILGFQDQLSNLKGQSIDIILETPGGQAEVVEDVVKLIRGKYGTGHVGIIIPGYSKSAGTIFAMAGDEILMGEASALGPIDAQINSNNKRFSAEAFLEGLEKIKDEVTATGKLNLAYVPILQNISPGEIQHFENAQNFSKKLVTEWLAKYKFRPWITHASSGKAVTSDEKTQRAQEIGAELCKQSKWLTHGRSIKIQDFRDMKLQITDYGENSELNDAILRYHTLLRMTFESTGLYKIFETISSQVMRMSSPIAGGAIQQPNPTSAQFPFQCPNCKTFYQFQANLQNNVPLGKNCIPFPAQNNTFICPQCKHATSLLAARLQIEAQTGKKVVK